LGEFFSSSIVLNDFFLIEELSARSKPQLLAKLNGLGDEAAAYIYEAASKAALEFPQVVVLTHVPPFRESCWHEGRISGDDWLPFFACKAFGNALLAVAEQQPHVTFTVLCGHTHGGGFCRIGDNLAVYTGAAEYGSPQLQKIFEL
jgi:Icc-related predicted phosphoesterase